MFSTYAINNDLKYVDEKIRNYYELGEFLSDAEVAEIDKLAERVEIEPPKGKEERRRSRKAETADATPERKQRKSREEVVEANREAVAEYMAECDKAVEEVADGREEVPFEEAMEAVADVPKPELETPPRRRRRRTE